MAEKAGESLHTDAQGVCLKTIEIMWPFNIFKRKKRDKQIMVGVAKAVSTTPTRAEVINRIREVEKEQPNLFMKVVSNTEFVEEMGRLAQSQETVDEDSNKRESHSTFVPYVPHVHVESSDTVHHSSHDSTQYDSGHSSSSYDSSSYDSSSDSGSFSSSD